MIYDCGNTACAEAQVETADTVEALNRYADRKEREVQWWERKFEAYLHAECGDHCACHTLMKLLKEACKKECP